MQLSMILNRNHLDAAIITGPNRLVRIKAIRELSTHTDLCTHTLRTLSDLVPEPSHMS